MEAVYTLLDVQRGVPEVFNSTYDIRTLLAATGQWLSHALKKHSTLVEKNIDSLSNLLQLNKAERALLLYGTLARYQRDLRSLLVEFKVNNAPEAYAEASARWYSLAGRIEESQVSSVFYPEKFAVEEDVIEVFGDLKQFTGTTRLENTTRTYRIAYQVWDGRFSLLSFKEKDNPTEEHQ